MKLITKKLWVFVAMLCTLISASAYDFEVDGIYYSISSEADKEVSVTYKEKNSASYSGVVNIPASVCHNGKTYTVKSIGNSAFYECSNLQSVNIPNSITTIGDWAFSGCSNLLSIPIPNSVTTIGYYAFQDCSNLQSVTIPNSVTYIEQGAFNLCSNLSSLTIGTGVKYVGRLSLQGLNKVIWLGNTRPKGYEEIKTSVNYVSNNEFGLSNQLVYPFLSSRFEVDNVVYVPVSPSERTCDVIDCNYAPSSTEIVIDSIVNNRNIQLKVLNVNQYSFYKNSKITSLKISNSGNIGENAFYSCDALETVVASNNGSIGKGAFYKCKSLKTANLSNKGYVGEEAFYNCKSLKTADLSNKA